MLSHVVEVENLIFNLVKMSVFYIKVDQYKTEYPYSNPKSIAIVYFHYFEVVSTGVGNIVDLSISSI